MADDLKPMKDQKEKTLDNQVTELDDKSLEEASGGGGFDQKDGDIVINNCNC